MSITAFPSGGVTAKPGVRRPGRPSRLAAELLPSTILASAKELFLANGFAATAVQEIADHAGVTKRTVYVKIGDKEAVFGAVVGAMLRDWRHVADEVNPADPLQLRFERLGRHLLSVMLEPDMVRLNRVMLAEAYRFPSMISLLVAQIEQGPIPQLARLLMQVRGEVGGPTQGDQVAARLFYDMVVGAPMRVALTGRPPSLAITTDEWVSHAVALFLGGWQDGGSGATRREA